MRATHGGVASRREGVGQQVVTTARMRPACYENARLMYAQPYVNRLVIGLNSETGSALCRSGLIFILDKRANGHYNHH